MSRDNGYDLPAKYNNRRHPQGIGDAHVLKAWRHHPWRRPVMAESSWRTTISSLSYGKISCHKHIGFPLLGGMVLRIRTSINFINRNTGSAHLMLTPKILGYFDTVKPVLIDHCHERPPVLTDHAFSAERPTFQYNWTCRQWPPVLTDHLCVANGLVFQDSLYCTSLSVCLMLVYQICR